MLRPAIIGLLLAAVAGVPLLALGRPYGLPVGLLLMGATALAWSLLLDRDRVDQGGAAFAFCAGLAVVSGAGHGPVPARLGWLLLAGGALWLATTLWRRHGGGQRRRP